MEPLLDPEEQDLERGLLSAGRDIHMSRRLQTQTLAALGVGAVSLTAAATAQAGTAVWFKTKIGILLLSVGGTMSALGASYWIADSDGRSRWSCGQQRFSSTARSSEKFSIAPHRNASSSRARAVGKSGRAYGGLISHSGLISRPISGGGRCQVFNSACYEQRAAARDLKDGRDLRR